MRMKNLAGQKFGMTTPVFFERRILNGTSRIFWLCQCGCGNKHSAKSTDIIGGKVRSCGCFRSKVMAGNKFNLKHGGACGGKVSKLYHVWTGIKSRCLNTNHKSYKHYGGRGIKLCPAWEQSYFEFKKWAESNGYSPNLQIDRKNNNGHYSPKNCRWTTCIENLNNTRWNRIVVFGNQKTTLAKAARSAGMEYKAAWRAINKNPNAFSK